MKLFTQILSLVLLGAVSAFGSAGSLPREQISTDAKWLLHLDVAQFRSTQSGRYVMGEVQRELIKPLAELRKHTQFAFDPEKIMTQINSVTLYGTDYKSPADNAVILIRTEGDLEKAFIGLLAGISLAGSNAPAAIAQTQQGPITFYSIKDQVFCAVLPGKVMAVGKTRRITEKAAQVLAGKAANLGSGTAFSGFGDTRSAFFFLGVAEGFSNHPAVPPQARVLQMADGVSVALGESMDKLFLNVALRAKTAEVVTQIQQVVQGIIALGALGQTDDQDLSQLMQSVKVSTNNRTVSVDMEYPVASAIRKVSEEKAKAEEKKARAEQERRAAREAEAKAREAGTGNSGSGK